MRSCCFGKRKSDNSTKVYSFWSEQRYAHVTAAASKWRGSMCEIFCKGILNGVSGSLLKCMCGTISSKSCYMAYILSLYSTFSQWHSNSFGAYHNFYFFPICICALKHRVHWALILLSLTLFVPTVCISFVNGIYILLYSTFLWVMCHILVNVCFIHLSFHSVYLHFGHVMNLSANWYTTLAAFHHWDWQWGHCIFMWSLNWI